MAFRGPGLTALSRHTTSTQAYSQLSSQLSTQQLHDLRSQLDIFATSLQTFAREHRKDILKDADFRGEFQRMCASIGIDPLAGRGEKVGGLKGMWNDWLGLGDYYYELGVQIVDVCVSTRDVNGGVMDMEELIRRVMRLRRGRVRPGQDEDSVAVSTMAVSEDDVVRAIKTLEPLGCGYEVVALATPGTAASSSKQSTPKLVKCLPGALSLDSTLLLSMLAIPSACSRDALSGYVYLTEEQLLPERTTEPRKPRWARQRARNALRRMCEEDGTLWVDHHDGEIRYYSLAVGQHQSLDSR
ncbi:unnamed protein product [Jaminaea pallidilutea]